VDVDLPQPKPEGGLLKRLFGGPKLPPSNTAQNDAIARVELWTRQHPDWSWRIYRTRAGLRLLAAHALFDPETAVENGVFEALGADPLYRQLCRAQKCFRARLTPKPWRCGVQGKPERWPWLNAKAEARFRKWEESYRSESEPWATCELIRQLGTAGTHPEVQPIVAVHDEATRAGSKLQLA
jgi:hypothetical protein